jgi:hypothetical protein
MKTIKILILLLSMTSFVMAGEKMSDAEIKQKLIGYWSNPHHGYHIAANGIMYMCPRWAATTKYQWSVKDGKFYGVEVGGQGDTIVTLTDKKFVYRDNRDGTTYTLIRGTKEQIDPPEK